MAQYESFFSTNCAIVANTGCVKSKRAIKALLKMKRFESRGKRRLHPFRKLNLAPLLALPADMELTSLQLAHVLQTTDALVHTWRDKGWISPCSHERQAYFYRIGDIQKVARRVLGAIKEFRAARRRKKFSSNGWFTPNGCGGEFSRLPQSPGVYVLAHREPDSPCGRLRERVLYVGSSVNLRQRVQSHPVRRELKALYDCVVVYFKPYPPSKIRKVEKKLIWDYQPKHNTQGVPERI